MEDRTGIGLRQHRRFQARRTGAWKCLNVRRNFAAGVATTSLKHAEHFKRHIQSGIAMVNLPSAGIDYHAPFGGQKGSSYGPREQGRYAVDFCTTVKTVYTNP